MALPTLTQFTRATLNLLRSHGIAEYHPTVVVDGDFYVIDNIPDDVDHRDALLKTIARDSLMKQDFLFAVRSADAEITLGQHVAETMDFTLIRALNDGFKVVPLAACDWWQAGR